VVFQFPRARKIGFDQALIGHDEPLCVTKTIGSLPRIFSCRRC
jgi:hypothetical protein